MDTETVTFDLRGDIAPTDLEALHALTDADDTSEVLLTSQLSGQSLLKVVVSIAKFGPKLIEAMRSIIRADNIKVMKVEVKGMKLTIENVNPKHFDAVGDFIYKIRQS